MDRKPSPNARRVAKWRERYGYSYSQAGIELGVTGEAVRQWEIEGHVPSPHTARRIEQRTGIKARLWPRTIKRRPRNA